MSGYRIDRELPRFDCWKRSFFAGSLAPVAFWQRNHSEGDSLYFLDPDGHKLEIHASDLNARIRSLRSVPPEGLVVFE